MEKKTKKSHSKENDISFSVNKYLIFAGAFVLIMVCLLQASVYLANRFGTGYNSSSARTAGTCGNPFYQYCVNGIYGLRVNPNTGKQETSAKSYYSGGYIIANGKFPPKTSNQLPAKATLVSGNCGIKTNLPIEYYSSNQMNIKIPAGVSTERNPSGPSCSWQVTIGQTGDTGNGLNYFTTIAIQKQ